MGGVKKKPVSQMETGLKDSAKEPKKGKTKGVIDKKVRGIFIPKLDNKDFLTDLSKIGAITPYTIATKYDLRLSVSKHILKELEKQGKIKLEEGNKRIKIYRYIGA